MKIKLVILFLVIVFGCWHKVALSSVGSQIAVALMSAGFTLEQSAGVVGNIHVESAGFNHRATSNNGKAYGLAQWQSDRQIEFKKLYGHDIHTSNMDEQVSFLVYELTRGREKAAGDKIKTTLTVQEAVLVTRKYYERANAKLAHDDRRISYALTVANEIVAPQH